MQNYDVIVLGCGLNGLSIVQEFAMQGLECCIMDTHRRIAGHSKFSTFIRCPDTTFEQQQFIEFIINFCKQQKTPPVIFPTRDHFALALSRTKPHLSSIAYPCVSDESIVLDLLDKQLFSQIGVQAGYMTAKTFSIQEITDPNFLGFPIVAKPISRQFSTDSTFSKELENTLNQERFSLIHNQEELEGYLTKSEKYLNHLMFQEFIPGDCKSMFTIGVYATKSKGVLGIFSGKKVRGYPDTYGDCAFGEAHQLPADLVDLTKRICTEKHIEGIAEFEFKQHQESKRYYLIEINPRSWSWIGITPACGVPLATMAYQHLRGLEVDKRDSLHLSNGAIRFGRFFEELLGKLLYPESNPEIGLFGIFQQYCSRNIIIAEFRCWDWPIIFWSLAAFFKKLIIWLFTGTK